MQENQPPRTQPREEPNTPAQQPGRNNPNPPGTKQPVKPGVDPHTETDQDNRNHRQVEPSELR